MTLNGLQLAAMLKLAVAMTRADGKVSDEEVTLQTVEFASFGVSGQQAKDILSAMGTLEYGQAIAIVSAMSIDQKKYVTGFLAAIMAADGQIVESEMDMWRLISTLASLPQMTVGEALEFWKKHKGK